MSGIKGLISCTAWVARGIASVHPQTYEVDDKELERISALAQLNIDEAKAEMDEANAAAEEFKGVSSDGEETDEVVVEDDQASDNGGDVDMKGELDKKQKKQKKSKEDAMERDDDLAQYNLDDYDEEQPASGANIFSNIKGLSYYADNAEDPYITLHDEDEEEAQELEIRPSDNLIIAAKTEDHVSSLEVYVYDESEDNLYAHHDILLPSFPVCLEWLDYPPFSSTTDSKTGNYVAVGTLDPDIEIWSLDVIESIFPDALLGDPKNKTRDETGAPIMVPSPTKKERKRRKPKANAEYHIDAILGLSWNRSHRNLLASASADKTVKLWDLSRELNSTAIRSFDLHRDKVQAVQWNRVEPTVLLTGSYDRTVRTFDSRSPASGFGAKLPSDVEALKWDPWEGHTFYVSLENGLVLHYDARTLPSDLSKNATALFTIQAHDGAASGLDINPHIRGFVATGGTDNLVKLWNVTEEGGAARVKMLTSRNLEVGKVFSVTWSPDDPLTLAAAGSEGKLQIWDVAAKSGVKEALGEKLPRREWRQRDSDVIGLVDDAEDDSDEDEE